MIDNIQIIQGNITHLEQIEEIENTLEHRNLSYNSLKNDLTSNSCYYLVAIQDNTLLGYVGIELLVDHADITAVAVSKDYLKKGIATLLLNNLFEKCKELNFDNIFLEVRTSNIPAINLYTKLGFKKISTRNNYYDNNEDADIYIKDLV